ncbi:MAG: TlpA family protein disulfide reductase [Clostridia bacterium]|nr:TlpA family protein disulfide reductase [Deltaproteobacteria bacterium]
MTTPANGSLGAAASKPREAEASNPAGGMNWRAVALVAITVLPIVGLLAFGFGHDPHAVPFAMKDSPAPDFTLRTLDGDSVRLSDMRGTPVVLNFWASWCEPCKFEHDLLQQASRYYGQSVRFLGVVYQDQEPAVRQYLVDHPSIYRHALDPDTKVAIDYGVSGVPESYLIDGDGVIREKSPGVISGDELRRWLDKRVSR